jgi:hypothetical protein
MYAGKRSEKTVQKKNNCLLKVIDLFMDVPELLGLLFEAAILCILCARR